MPKQNSVPRFGRILHSSPVKRIQSYSSLPHCLCLHSLYNFFSFFSLHVYRRSPILMESTLRCVQLQITIQPTQQTHAKIKISRIKLSHLFTYICVSELYLYIFVWVKIHCFQTLHYISYLLNTNHSTYKIISNLYYLIVVF